MDKKYFIIIGDKKIDVSEEVYKNYWHMTNRERYLERLDWKNRLLFFSDLNEEYPPEDYLPDENCDLEKIVETKALIDRVREAVSSLNDEERDIIKRLYYDDESLRLVALSKEMSAPALMKRRNKILKKLKELLKDLM